MLSPSRWAHALNKYRVLSEGLGGDDWFREQVQQALNDPRPAIPHDEAIAKLEAMLKEKRNLRATG